MYNLTVWECVRRKSFHSLNVLQLHWFIKLDIVPEKEITFSLVRFNVLQLHWFIKLDIVPEKEITFNDTIISGDCVYFLST